MKKPLRTRAAELGLSGQVNDAMFNHLSGAGALADKLTAAGERGPASSGGGGGGMQQYFTTFDSSRPMSLNFTSLVSFPRGQAWRATMVCVLPAAGAYFGSEPSSDRKSDRWGVLSNGQVFGMTDASDEIGGDVGTPIGQNQLVTMEVQNAGGLTHYINGSPIHTAAVGSFNPRLSALGTQFAGTTSVPNFQGVIYSIELEVNGAVVLHYVLDEEYSTTNNTVTDLSGNNNHGTFVNIADGDSKLYTQDANGDWVSGGETLGGLGG